jgi:hypothetical protein
MRPVEWPARRRRQAAWRLIDGVAGTLVLAGALGAAFGWRGGAILAVVGLLAAVAGHVAVGVADYRDTMRRRWPRVPPLADDDF